LLQSDFLPQSRPTEAYETPGAALQRAASDRTRHLSELMPKGDVARFCQSYVADFSVPCLMEGPRQVHLLRTAYDDNISNDHSPKFYLPRAAGAAHPATSAECENADMWALGSICFTVATGIFICRRTNTAALVAGRWTLKEEVAALTVPQRHLWERLPVSVREILAKLLQVRGSALISVASVLASPFLQDLAELLQLDVQRYHKKGGVRSVEGDSLASIPITSHVYASDAELPPLLYIQGRSLAAWAELTSIRARCTKILSSLPAVATVNESEAQELLLSASRVGDARAMQPFLDKYDRDPKILDCTDHVGRTPLFNASSRGYVNCVRALLASGADPRVSQRSGSNALVVAIENGHLACVEALLSHCPIGVPNSSSEVVNIVNHGPDRRTYRRSWLVNTPCNLERIWYPLHYAVYHNRIDVIQLLFSFGANLLMSDNAGRTPSFYSGAKVQPLCDVNIKQALADESPLRTLLREQEKAVRTQQTLTLQRNRRCVKAGEDTRDVRPTTLASEYFHDDKRSLCCNLSELMVTLALERAALHALVKREKLDVPVKDTVAEAIRVAARTDDVLKLRSIWDKNSDRAGWEETLAAADPGHRTAKCTGVMR
jgi:hypothetical protein